MKQLIAYAYRSGQIGFTSPREGIPNGALFIARGPTTVVGPLVRGNARLAYDNETYLVPGCPEATTETEAFEAFMRFFERIRNAMLRKVQA